jgi:hypothetical protein
VRERLEDVLAVSRFLEEEYPALIARFEARRGEPARGRRKGPAGQRAGRT